MSDKKELHVSAQVTPNPDTLKFLVDQQLVESGVFNFTSKEATAGSVLPNELFNIVGVSGVMVASNFVSVSKITDVNWTDLIEPVIETIKRVLASGEPVIDQEAATAHQSGSDSESEKRIKEILDAEIRPAVAMDGGDVVFESYQDGVLALSLQGACSSCPSATLTLKMGIENRLKEEIAELQEVIQV